MQYLKDTKIIGSKHHVSNLRKLFGMTYFGQGGIILELTHVFANGVYGGVSLASKRSVKNEPLYILVPNKEIDAVWPPAMCQSCTDFEVRFGPASRVGGTHICNAVSIRIGRSVMYLCLDPNGRLVDKSSNMGV